ncbi:MAG TPA: histidine phosphatase family protein [Puia sp.]|jgi:phosphohistidine phosphatase
MKTLLIIRHAKSSWDTATLSDFDRPLNERGKKDAPAMAKRLLENKVTPELFIASPAKRAKKTAELFIKEFGKSEKEIVFISELYHAPADLFYDIIAKFDDKYNSIAIFSHNPGITDFVNLLTTVQVDNMPTCGIFAVTSPANTWDEFSSAEKEFWFFDYPKTI